MQRSLHRPQGDNSAGRLEACGVAVVFAAGWPFISHHTERVRVPSGTSGHQQFYLPCFSQALGFQAMCCLRIAAGVVVGQPGQLGIGQLTIAPLLVPIWCLSLLWKARRSYLAALWSLARVLACSRNPRSLFVAAIPAADTSVGTSRKSQVLVAESIANNEVENVVGDLRVRPLRCWVGSSCSEWSDAWGGGSAACAQLGFWLLGGDLLLPWC